MRKNKVKEMMKAGKPVINGWLQIPSTVSAEVMAHQGWDSLTIDMQHGLLITLMLFQCYKLYQQLMLLHLQE